LSIDFSIVVATSIGQYTTISLLTTFWNCSGIGTLVNVSQVFKGWEQEEQLFWWRFCNVVALFSGRHLC